MIRKRPEKDLEHPPGQIVYPLPHFEKPLVKAIEEYKQQKGCYPGCYYYTDSCFRDDCQRKDE